MEPAWRRFVHGVAYRRAGIAARPRRSQGRGGCRPAAPALPGAPLPDLERVADERQFEEIEGCGAYLWVLGTIGSSAPFIGLFGTVVGIMRAFHSMALVGTGGFGVVAGGISEALIATALGLAIGIVALVFYNYLQNRVERIDGALRIGSARLLEAMAAVRRSHGAV